MKVNVLLSAYNGQDYIAEQIESILVQTHTDLHLYIRDDGSTDGTVDVLRSFEANPRITLVVGENIGYSASFYQLLQLAEDGMFWAFSDQDDVWLPDKLAWAVQWLQDQPVGHPLLFHSAYELVSTDLSTLGVVLPPKQIGLHTVIADCVYQGFSLVMNRELRDMVLRCDPKRLTSHDWIACLIVTEFGQAYYDSRIASKHRRHGGSISGMSWSTRWKWFCRALSGSSEIGATTREFTRVFGPELPPEDRRLLQRFTREGYHLADALAKAFYPKRWRKTLSSELSLRLLMLLGRI